MTTDLYTNVALHLARCASNRKLSPLHYLIGFGFPEEDAKNIINKAASPVRAEAAVCTDITSLEISAIAKILQEGMAA